MKVYPYTCGIDAEPLHRYCPGGYHPVHLGDVLGSAKYQITHKLGWGGYSTVWAAKEQRSNRNVAIKVKTADCVAPSHELEVLRDIASSSSDLQPRNYLLQLLDDFTIEGPNGMHACIVTELLGSNVSDMVDDLQRSQTYRLPAVWAKLMAKQLLVAVDHLHQKSIGHGDIHTRNLAYKHNDFSDLDSVLTEPETGDITCNDGSAETSSLPRYLVRPSSLRITPKLSHDSEIRLIDFGESFKGGDKPKTLNTPLTLRAPEVIFEDEWDHRVDLWSAGCTIFELITGQPPFDTGMITKDLLIGQMIDEIGPLPSRWQAKSKCAEMNDEDTKYTLEQWLFELYFDSDKKAQFTHEELQSWATVISRLMKFEASERASPADVLKERCFLDD